MKRVLRIGVAIICMVTLVVGYYSYLSHRNAESKTQEATELSEVTSILSKDFENDYPVTPRAVLKWYNRIIAAYYSEEYSDEELVAMADQARCLLDDDLLALNSRDRYLVALKADISDYKDRNRMIVSSTVSDTKEVEYKTVNGYECAYISAYYFIREGSTYDRTYEDFCLRKDENGKWKILSWQLSQEDDTNGF